MAPKLGLTAKQTQTLKLSPTQIQVMRMLELPSCELIAYINDEMQTNPALEEGVDKTVDKEDDIAQEDEYTNPLQNDDFDYDDYTNDDDAYERSCASNNTSSRAREGTCGV